MITHTPRRRMRAWVNWVVRWGSLVPLLAVAFLYAVSWNREHSVRYGRGERHTPGEIEINLLRGGVAFSWREGGGWAGTLRPKRLHYSSIGWPEEKMTLLMAATVGFRPGVPVADFRFPLWPAIPACVAAGAWAWTRRSRWRLTGCPCCNYDLSGLSQRSPCPECSAVRKP
jgi:hypothetical protein